jgi:hypothetical protein
MSSVANVISTQGFQMKTPEILIPGFRGFDFSDAVEIDEYTKRGYVREALKVMEDGKFFAEATTVSSGDTLILVIKNKRTGQHEVYDLKVRAHYLQDIK